MKVFAPLSCRQSSPPHPPLSENEAGKQRGRDLYCFEIAAHIPGARYRAIREGQPPQAIGVPVPLRIEMLAKKHFGGLLFLGVGLFFFATQEIGGTGLAVCK
jgi:hypothetical protein